MFFAILPLLIFIIFRYPVFAMNIDEAGQYWMALGQNHFTPFYSESKGLSVVISQNNAHNLDPGGFTYILHYWLMVSHHYLWIKLLPMIFFIGFIIYLVKFLRLFLNKDDEFIALLIIPILFISNALPFYGVLLRAYSMEYLGIIITLYYLFSTKIPENFYLKAGIICSLFLWSRYGFGIHILALYLVSLVKFKTLYDIKLFFKNSLYFGIPILISIICIFFITLKYQFIKPTYNPSYLRYISDGDIRKAFELIYLQVASFINIPLITLIISGFVIKKFKVFNEIHILYFSPIKLLIIYFGFYHLINFVLSYLGLYPYSTKSYNSKQFEFFNILSIFFLAIILIGYFQKFKTFTVVLIVVVGIYLSINKRDIGENNLLYVLNKYNTDAGLYISKCNYPTTRYLIEEKMFIPKYNSVNIYHSDSLLKSGSIIIYNESEHIYFGKADFDSSFKKLESLNSKKPSYNSEVYIKK